MNIKPSQKKPRYVSAADIVLHLFKADTKQSDENEIYRYTKFVWDAAVEYTMWKINNNINDKLPDNGECF